MSQVGNLNHKPQFSGSLGVKVFHGQTPYIGENGNWFIGETDTGVRAEGMSAYEVACAFGFEGTEQEWLESLNGEDGKSGVYIGDEAPIDPSVNIWIDPNGGNDKKYATKAQLQQVVNYFNNPEATGYATQQYTNELAQQVQKKGKEYVNEAIANIQFPIAEQSMELLVDCILAEDVAEIIYDLDKPGYFSEMRVFVDGVAAKSSSSDGQIWMGGKMASAMQVDMGTLHKGDGCRAQAHIALLDDSAFYYAFSTKTGSPYSTRSDKTAKLSQTQLFDKFVLAIKNGTVSFGAGTRVRLYGRRVAK